MFEPLNAEDPEAGKGMLLLAYFLQSILLPLSSCGQRFFYDGFVEAKKIIIIKFSKKCRRVHLYCIVLYCISDVILNYKLRRHVIRTFDFIP